MSGEKGAWWNVLGISKKEDVNSKEAEPGEAEEIDIGSFINDLDSIRDSKVLSSISKPEQNAKVQASSHSISVVVSKDDMNSMLSSALAEAMTPQYRTYQEMRGRMRGDPEIVHENAMIAANITEDEIGQIKLKMLQILNQQEKAFAEVCDENKQEFAKDKNDTISQLNLSIDANQKRIAELEKTNRETRESAIKLQAAIKLNSDAVDEQIVTFKALVEQARKQVTGE